MNISTKHAEQSRAPAEAKRSNGHENRDGNVAQAETSRTPLRNPGLSFDLDWARSVRANRSAIEHRAATLTTRRSVKKEHQAAWLLRAVTLIDLTTLAGDDTPGRVRRLAGKARRPVRSDLLQALGVEDLELKTGAVCVYHDLIEAARMALVDSGVPVCAVSTGFPAGQIPHEMKLDQIRASVEAGADEIDIVISRANVLTGHWDDLYDEVREFKEACADRRK